MVQLLASPSLAQNGTAPPLEQDSSAHVAGVAARVLMAASLATRHESKMNAAIMTRDEHAQLVRDLHLSKAGFRTPRRAWSTSEDDVQFGATTPLPQNLSRQIASSAASPGASPLSVVVVQQPNHQADDVVVLAAVAAPTTPLPQEASRPTSPRERDASAAAAAAAAGGSDSRPRRRPALGPPRRSYSVMDYEPAPRTHRLSDKMAIGDLPSELHYAIFDFLDPIDSTCFGLTNKHFYAIHRRMHGTVPLSTRRSGPNDLEWAWRLAGPIIHPAATNAAGLVAAATAAGAPTTTNVLGGAAQDNALDRLRVRGHVYCRKCGISRCELHRHLREWVGQGREYCSVKQKFGRAAPEGAKEFCYMSSPKRPHRCGRHDVKPKVQA